MTYPSGSRRGNQQVGLRRLELRERRRAVGQGDQHQEEVEDHRQEVAEGQHREEAAAAAVHQH